jgi:hypothetical protein
MSSSSNGSAAHIFVRQRSKDDDPMRRLLDACGPNKNDQAIALITACIGDDVNTGVRSSLRQCSSVFTQVMSP